MGIVYESHVAVAGVPAAALRELAARHAGSFADRQAGWDVLDFLNGLQLASVDGLCVWGACGKDMHAHFERALGPFFCALLAAHPDARVIRSIESDHDDGEGAQLRELSMDDPTWRSIRAQWRIAALSDAYDAASGFATPPWAMRSAQAYVILWEGQLEGDPGARAEVLSRLRKARSKDLGVRSCFAALASCMEAPAGSRASTFYPAWCHTADPIDVGALCKELARIGGPRVIVGYQPVDDTLKIALGGPAFRHYDTPAGLCWSPSIVRAAAETVVAPGTRPRSSMKIARSPHRAATLRQLDGLSLVGLKDKPVFQDILALDSAARRALLFDISAHAPAPIARAVASLAFLIVEYGGIVETERDVIELLEKESILPEMARDSIVDLIQKIIAREGLSPALASAVLASKTIADRAAKTPVDPDMYEQAKLPFRALTLHRLAEGQPPFARDAWSELMVRELSALPEAEQADWRAFIEWFEHADFPFVVSKAARTALGRRANAIEGAEERASAWLEAFAKAQGASVTTDDPRNLRFVEGLLLLAPYADVAGVVERFDRVYGAATPPRAAFRALRLLCEQGEREALAGWAERASSHRVRAYTRVLLARSKRSNSIR